LVADSLKLQPLRLGIVLCVELEEAAVVVDHALCVGKQKAPLESQQGMNAISGDGRPLGHCVMFARLV
jgi:hypothetical protein